MADTLSQRGRGRDCAPSMVTSSPSAIAAERQASHDLGRLPLLAFVTSIALVAISVADTAARGGDTSWSQPLFWIALVGIVFPTAVRLASAAPSMHERLGLVVVIIVGLYLVKVIYEPNQFALHDELAQLRTTNDIDRTGHLFQLNPIVRAYAYFPGLNTATVALSRVTHLSTFFAGVLLIGVARLIGGLAIVYVLDRLTGDSRLACVGFLVYLGNPNYLYFNAEYGYESLALPLALAALLAVSHRLRIPGRPYLLNVFVCLIIAAVVVTHHIASYWLVGTLLIASGLGWFRLRNQAGARITSGSFVPAMFGCSAILLWQFGVARSATEPEVAPIGSGVSALIGRLTGAESGPGKVLFASSTGHGGDPPWAQVLGFAAVGIALLLVLAGTLTVLRDRWWRNSVFVLPVTMLALALPVTLALRLTQAGTETSNRASEYLYIGVGLLGGASIAIRRSAGRHAVRAAAPLSDRARAMRTRLPWAVGVVASILLAGGLIVGWAPYERQPGPFLAAADMRSVDSPGIAAATWAANHLQPGAFIAADQVNGLLMSAYASLNPQRGRVRGFDVTALFYSKAIGVREKSIIAGDRIAYIIVDLRLTRDPPYSKGYFDGDHPPGIDPAKPLSRRCLTKFGRTQGFSRLFSNGPIAIYSTGLKP